MISFTSKYPILSTACGWGNIYSHVHFIRSLTVDWGKISYIYMAVVAMWTQWMIWVYFIKLEIHWCTPSFSIFFSFLWSISFVNLKKTKQNLTALHHSHHPPSPAISLQLLDDLLLTGQGLLSWFQGQECYCASQQMSFQILTKPPTEMRRTGRKKCITVLSWPTKDVLNRLDSRNYRCLYVLILTGIRMSCQSCHAYSNP